MATPTHDQQHRTWRPTGRTGHGLVVAMIASALVLGLGAPAGATVDGPDPRAVDRFMEEQLRRHDIPGIAVALLQDGRVIYSAGYGTASGDAPVTPDTPFMLGSVTKPFTAAAVLQLVEQGLLELDAPVRRYLPWFAVADEHGSAAITVRHLLNHTSGLSDLADNRPPDADTSLEDSVRALSSARPTAAPGTRYEYFNRGYAVLALLVEVASGQSYGDYVRTHVHEPLHLVHSFTDVEEATAAGMAAGHTRVFGLTVPRKTPDGPSQVGYGHLVGSVSDVADFALALTGDDADGTRLLRPESVALLRAAPPTDPASNYGMGWSVWERDGTRFEGHSGAEETFMSSLVLLPEHHSGYVWLMNRQNALDPVRAELDAGLTDLLLGREPSPAGRTMSLTNAIALTLFVLGLLLVARSSLRLRSWADRSRALSVPGVVLRVVRRVALPLVLLWSAFHGLGEFATGLPIAFNFRHIGAYYAPEIALLLALAIFPALAQGSYMAVTAGVARRRR